MLNTHISNDIPIESEILYDHLINTANYVLHITSSTDLTKIPHDILILTAIKLPINKASRFFKDIRVELTPSEQNYFWGLLFKRDFPGVLTLPKNLTIGRKNIENPTNILEMYGLPDPAGAGNWG